MRRQDDGRTSPRWRGVLEARWRARLDEVTELSVAYHAAAADVLAGIEHPRARLLLHRATEARRRLADTEDALGKMAMGDFGRCEHCGAFIAEVLLAAVPESRYCTGCAVDLGAGDLEAGGMTGPARPGRVMTAHPGAAEPVLDDDCRPRAWPGGALGRHAGPVEPDHAGHDQRDGERLHPVSTWHRR